MAIPITCPGCRATFEVPETLAGKTIRCTSCKTQLTVPAAAATPPGETKKPFGWASSPAAAGQALSLDDDPPVPPAKPAAKAAPAKAVPAKAAPRAAVVVAEDDGKTSPAKPAAKNGPGIKGAPKKRQDDDEDDDDDDRPRRKKGAGARSGPMIALIGGGVVCLAAIVGLSVWLLSGDDKKDSAKTDNTNNPAPQTPTGGGPRPVPGGGGEGGEGGVVPPDGGGDGMPPDFGMNPGPGGDGNIPLPPPPSGTGGGSGTIPLPPPPTGTGGGPAGGGPGPRPGGGNVGAGGGNPFGGLGQLGNIERLGTPGAWANFDGDGFSAEFPGTPEIKEMNGNGMSMKITAVGAKSEPVVAVMQMQMPGNLGAKQMLDLMALGLKNNPGVSGLRDVTVGDHPAKEVQVSEKGATVTMRVVPAGNRLYMFIAGGESKGPGRPALPQASLDRFFGSIKVTYTGDGGNVAGGGPNDPPTPGGGFPRPPMGGFPRPPGTEPGSGGFPQPPDGGIGQPPEPGGGFPQPPAGGGFPQPPGGGFPQPPGGGDPTQPTQPSAGSFTPGNKKADLGQFFAGAFDGTKKELYTFSARPSGTAVTTRLNRFDVANNFGGKGSFRMPNFVCRAVVDPAKGLLYVATVSRPSAAALAGQMYDQAVGVGDVQIFDLAPVHEGKVKDGADLKPLATIPFGRAIRGLELSNDGKTLFVVSSTAGRAAKSYLHVYDAETRKAANPPKELEAPAWDMCKSPDGKTLVVVDTVEPGKPSLLRVFDTASLVEVKKLSLPGGANDVAAAAGGNVAAAVFAGGNIKLMLANDKATRDLDTILGAKAASKPGYLEFSPDGKTLFVAGHPAASGMYARQGQPQQQPAGLDVYDVVDLEAPTGGLKKKASILTAGGSMVGGHFLVSPGGEYLVFHTGVVVETANVGGNNGEGPAGGVGGGYPGGFPAAPGGGFPQAPGGGSVPPGPGVGGDIGLPGAPGGGAGPRPGGRPFPGGPGGGPRGPGGGAPGGAPGGGSPPPPNGTGM